MCFFCFACSYYSDDEALFHGQYKNVLHKKDKKQRQD